MLPLWMVLICWGGAPAEPAVAAAPQQEMGFLEDVFRETGSERFQTRVRLAFQCRDGHWSAFECKPENVEELKRLEEKYLEPRCWKAVLHGKVLGRVCSEPLAEFNGCAEVGSQQVAEGEAIPDAGSRTAEFSGWMAEPVRRPLVLLKEAHCDDPDGWRALTEVKASPAFVDALKDALKVPAFADELPDAAQFAQDDFEGLEAYESHEGDRLYSVSLKEIVGRNDGYSFWFYESKGQAPRFIGGGLGVLDWGDFDGDGSTDFVFFVDRYNENGYRLLADGFRQSATFVWNYH